VGAVQYTTSILQEFIKFKKMFILTDAHNIQKWLKYLKCKSILKLKSCVSSDTIVMGWMDGVQFLAGERFSFLHSIQTGSGAHPASYPIGTRGNFPGALS
jgi:hypothetical protein